MGESAVHERQLEFEFEVRDGTQAAKNGTTAPLGRVVNGQPGKGNDFDGVAVFPNCVPDKGAAFFKCEERRF